jgi:hypothetical protein
MFLLSNFSHGGLVPYEGCFDKDRTWRDDMKDEHWYKPPKNIRYGIIVFVLGGLAYIIFS